MRPRGLKLATFIMATIVCRMFFPCEYCEGCVLHVWAADDQEDAHPLVYRTSMHHSGHSTIDLNQTHVPGGLESLVGQFESKCSGKDGIYDSLVSLFKTGFIIHPKLILTFEEKMLGQSQFARLGSTPRLMFGLNKPIFQIKVAITVKDNTSAAFRASGLVEPLYFYVEGQLRFMGSLEDILVRPALSAFDYVILVFGYVHDFQVWIDDGVIPFDARPGNIFYTTTVEDDRAAFFWGECRPARNPSDTAWLWASAIGNFNGVFERLRAHLERADAFAHRDVVLGLIDIATDAAPAWQRHSHNGTRLAAAELRAVQKALLKRIARAPDAVRAPFLYRFVLMAANNQI